MLEIKVTIEAPELASAINNLAKALNSKKELSVPDETNPKKGVEPPQPAQTVIPPQPAPNIPVAPIPQPEISTTIPAPMQQSAPTVPVAPPQQYTIEQIMQAGASLMDAGKMNELSSLLQSFGVIAVTQLKPEQLGAFATALRGLGAKI